MVVITRLTRSGQLTMPAEVRRELGLGPGDSVIWTKDAAGNTIIRAMRYTVEELDRILPAIDHPSAETDFEDMIAEAFEDSVEDKIREFDPR